MYHYCILCAGCKLTLQELKDHYKEYHPYRGFTYETWKYDSRNPDNWSENKKLKCIFIQK